MEDLKAAGLLRKGQILGALMDNTTDGIVDDDDQYQGDDLLEDGFLEAAYDGDDNAAL